MPRYPTMLPALLLALSTALLPGAVLAAEGACMSDMERLCGDVSPGGGAKLRCLRQHQSELSGDCRERLADRSRRAESVLRQCGADARRLCKGIDPGQGALAGCLRGHASELSDECREALPKP